MSDGVGNPPVDLRLRQIDWLLKYGAAVLLSVVALFLTMLLDDAQVEPNTRLLFIAAVAFSSWYGGLGAGLVATALTSLESAYFFHHIGQSPFPNDFASAVRFIEFVAIALAITLLNAARLKEQRRATVARAEAEAASRIKDEFLATVSHDLRTPLTSMRGWASMLRSRQLDEATTIHALEAIELNADAQAQLISDLLDVSRISAGQMRLDVRPLDLAAIIKAASEVVHPAAQAKNIQLRVALDPSVGVVAVAGDPARLQQVMWNLLSNAVKFTPEGGEVAVRLARLDAYAEITVSDTGVGISPDFLPHIFERFSQGGGAQSNGGLGLGLSIVRHLVELHGGTIQAANRGDGGATFTVNLPLIKEASSVMKANP